jgi:hypothetical protein
MAIVGGLYGTIANASRTLLYLTVICFILALLMYSVLYYRENKAVKVWMRVFASLAIVGIAMWLDLFHMAEWFANTALGQRFTGKAIGNGISNNLRLLYTRDLLKLLPKYPMGDLPYSHYAHNFWVDIAKEAGVIPFALYILFNISSLRVVARVLKIKNIGKECKVFIASVTVAYFIVFFSEPIMIGSPQIFAIFCFMIGCLTSIVKKNITGYHQFLQ